MTFAILFNTINGYLNGRYLFYFAPIYQLSWLSDPRFIIGTIIFFTGFITNIYSDGELRQLRRPGEEAYRNRTEVFSGLFQAQIILGR
jgi:hypothetical protein